MFPAAVSLELLGAGLSFARSMTSEVLTSNLLSLKWNVSLAPLMVIVTTCAVPSIVVTLKQSVSVSQSLSACTSQLALSSL
jgi:hypothetical protein